VVSQVLVLIMIPIVEDLCEQKDFGKYKVFLPMAISITFGSQFSLIAESVNVIAFYLTDFWNNKNEHLSVFEIL